MTAAYLKAKIISSKNSSKDFSCRGKARFESAVLAHAVVDRYPHAREKRQPYHCKICGSYHIGTIKRGQGTQTKAAQAELIRKET